MPKKALFVAYDVAPLELISSQRVNHFIRFLCAHNYDVDILTSVKTSIDGPCTDVDNYEKLKQLANFYEVGSIVNINSRSLGVTKSQTKTKLRSCFKNIRSKLAYLFGFLVDYRTLWAIRAIIFYRKNLQNTSYDLIFSSSLPAGVNLVAAYAKAKVPTALWISDHRDLWSMNHVVNRSWFARGIDKIVELRVLNRADVLTTVSDELSKTMEDLHKKRCLVVMNGYIPEEYENLQADRKFFNAEPEALNIVYAGNIYEGRRDPTPLLTAIANSKHRDLIKVHFFGLYLAGLEVLIGKYSYQDFCFIHGSLGRDDVLRVNKAADFNLFLESGQSDAKGVLTGKIFELIAVGRPVLCLGPKKDFKSVEILNEAGLLLHWDDVEPNSLYECLRDRTSEGTSPQAIDLYSRDRQAGKLLEYL
jgi:hypothetical protein